MAIAIVSLILFAIIALVAVPVLARVLGSAARRDDDRPGEEAVGLSDQKRPNNEEIEDEAEAIKRTGPLFGGAAAVFGILMGLVGAVLATGIAGDASYLNTIPLASLGTFLGITAYALGARKIGKSAIIFTMAALIFGVAASQGYVPGLQATDRGLPAQEPGSGAGAVDGR